MSDVRVSRGVKRLPLMLAAGLLGAALSAAQAQPDPVHAFDWPRQPLHDALQRYSELTGDSVLYDAGHVADKTAPALSGRYSSRDALQKLLAGSGLQAIYTTPRALMLRPARAQGRAGRRPPALLRPDPGARAVGPVRAPGAARGRIPRRLADHAGRLPRH